MRLKAALAAAFIVVGMVSCGEVTSPASKGGGAALLSQEALLEKADQLGKSELARLSAAEMIYRNKVYDHIYIDEDNGVRTDILMKYYRNFRDVKVLDVKRTDSLLYPVAFEIQYDYDILGTKGEAGLPQTMVESAKKAKNDNAFQVYASDSLVRSYRCSEAGECDVLNPDLLPRPNYWELNAWAKKNGVLQVDDMTQLAGL